jgi:hypothetical protein
MEMSFTALSGVAVRQLPGSNCRELNTATGRRVYSLCARFCIHRTPDTVRMEKRSRLPERQATTPHESAAVRLWIKVCSAPDGTMPETIYESKKRGCR